MNLKINIFVNYIAQIYITIICFVTLPLYIKYMGAEAFGLVGFFAMLQSCFSLLDMGLTPTMARETARFRGGATPAHTYRSLVRALEVIFLGITLVGGGAMFAAAGYISSDWLQVEQLPGAEVRTTIQLIAIIVALRWMCGLYRGAISGSERLVWLGGYNAFIATLRFLGVILVLKFIGTTPTIFFSYQLGVAVLELTGLVLHAYRLLPQFSPGHRLTYSWKSLKPVFKFSLTIAFPAAVWVVVTQIDKLVLSKILPLADYGYFTLAVLVASSVMMIGDPVGTALMPRMAKLEAEGDQSDLIRVYRQSTQLVALMAGAASITIAFCAESLLWVWTGDRMLAHQAAPILILYALGNGILAVSVFPFYLQYAKGNLRLHLIGNAVFVVLLIPAMIWAASQYGGIGAGYVWLVMNILCFIVWLPFVHHKFVPGLNLKWYGQDTLMIFLAVAVTGYFFNIILPQFDNRLWQLGKILTFGGLLMLVGFSVSVFFRERINLPVNLTNQR